MQAVFASRILPPWNSQNTKAGAPRSLKPSVWCSVQSACRPTSGPRLTRTGWSGFVRSSSALGHPLANPALEWTASPRAQPDRWASLHPTVPAPQVPAQDRGSRDMPVPGSSASSCRCYGCRPIRRRHGAGSCRVSSTTVYCMRSIARHTRRFSFFHPHVTQSSNPVHVGLLGRRNAQLIIPADALRAPLNSGLSGNREYTRRVPPCPRSGVGLGRYRGAFGWWIGSCC